MSLKKSLFWSYLSHYGSMVIQLGSSIILARLLIPEEIGIFSVALSFIALGNMIRGFGTGEYLIQEKELTTEKIQSSFTLAIIVAWVLSIIIYLISEPLALFYNEKGIAQILPIIAINFLFVPFGSITIALLRREMRFDKLIKINLSSAFMNASTSILLAMNGYSFMSLAWGAVAGTLTSVVVSQLYRPEGLSFIPALSKVREIIVYGSYNTLTNFTSSISTSAPDLIMGKMLDMHFVGIFSRGNGLLQMVSNLVVGGIRPILLPYFSQQHRENPHELAPAYLKMVDATLSIMWPILVFLALYSHEIIMFLFGDKWLEAVPVVQILTIGTSIWISGSLSQDIFKATNNIKTLTGITTIISLLRVIMLIIGSYFGFITALILFSATSIAHSIVVTYKLHEIISFNLNSLLKILLKNTLITIAIITPPLFIKSTTSHDAFITLLISGCIFAIMLALFLYKYQRELIYSIVNKKKS